MKLTQIAGPAAALALGAATLVIAAPAAYAGGTSSSTYGCYSTWGDTGASTHCYKVTRNVTVRTFLDCELESDDHSPYTSIGKGSTVSNFGQVECNYHAASAHPEFK